MKKIPTVFVRDADDMRRVTSEVTAGCEWVFAGEGEATRKYDGTCVLIRRDGLAVKAFARREVKRGKTPPPGFAEAEHDETTGKTVGWEPIDQSGFAKFAAEAIDAAPSLPPGTYELCGPKIQGNPEGFDGHVLIAHDSAERLPDLDMPPPSTGILGNVLRELPWEGLVWHHPDGRMAKLKKRDFPRSETP